MGKNQDPGSRINIPDPQHCKKHYFLQAKEEEPPKWRLPGPAEGAATFPEDSEDSPEENEEAFEEQDKFLLLEEQDKDEEEDSRVEDSGLGSASERTNFSEDRDSPGLSVIERARRLQGRIDQVEERVQ
jgi:hypothetical protein